MKRSTAVLATVLGTMISGAGVGIFLTPNKIVGGGVSGVATVLFHTLHIPVGVTIMFLNVALLLVGMKFLGKEFTVRTLLGVLLFSGFSQLFSMVALEVSTPMLASLFGAILYGAGIGICFAAGSSTGGTDIVGRMVQIKFPTVPIGKLLLGADGVVILISLLVFRNVELTLYGIISLVITTYTVDLVIRKLNVSRMVFVVTDLGDEIAKELISNSPRGITRLEGVGAYTGKHKKVLFCVMKASETEAFQNIILQMDPNAFIVFSEAQAIKGNGFYLYK